ncbi:hypothetical protein IC229_19130 [Spirosoma sp. BT702]|uniref:Uncharacterized protein n=1 Tax=Spirosoma profusum TaxID=2771354 RepID=A0A926XXL3_9BACT|nr:hypothetical protein [Spirosoma profusum]MBD2702769.1 hypothetical protein [Spirosoma profusum]
MRTEAAYISDSSLIADGCEDHVRLEKTDSTGNGIPYKPTDATLPIYQKALATIPPKPNSNERNVTVRFIETGKQVKLLCGWGHTPSVAEIEILEIKAR